MLLNCSQVIDVLNYQKRIFINQLFNGQHLGKQLGLVIVLLFTTCNE